MKGQNKFWLQNALKVESSAFSFVCLEISNLLKLEISTLLKLENSCLLLFSEGLKFQALEGLKSNVNTDDSRFDGSKFETCCWICSKLLLLQNGIEDGQPKQATWRVS